MKHARRSQKRFGAKRHRVEELVVEPSIEDIDAFESVRGPCVEERVTHHEILSLDEIDSHLAGEKSVLVVRGVVQARE